jgi:SAM-dependent methyltransferase
VSPRLYADLAYLWPLVSPPALYRQEAARVAEIIRTTAARTVRSVLELGSGGGHLASHLRTRFEMTLVDRSVEMLEQSRGLNQHCRHRQGTMEAIRLGERFDAVLIYDAISYIASETGLRLVFATAREHVRPGGVVLLGPDAFRETFEERTYRGTCNVREMRFSYVERCFDPDPDDSLVTSDFVFNVHIRQQPPRTYRDRHLFGLFPRATWLNLLANAGFSTHISSCRGHRDFIAGVPR